jgi:leucyl aminopeptidase
MTPAIFVQKARELLVGTSVSVSEIAGDALTSGRFGGIQGVGSGSRNAPRLLELRFGPAVNPDITLVGKGITFDSGGISIKSSDALMSMKNDVSGAAAVLGAMTLAPIVAPTLTIHAIIPLAENMPDGAAMRPGDVIEVRDGSTIEVLNTDFEGRLVLADGIAYASESSPRRVLDIASLTYAAINALGTDMAALLGNDESFLKDLERSAVSSGEDVWRMPLNSRLRGQILSEIADFKNFPGSPYARSITAALLLREFVGAGILWAHLDISGPCWLETSDNASVAGGTGYGVRLIAEVLATYEAMNHSTES